VALDRPAPRAALYARVSTDGQARDGTVASQLEALLQRARQDGCAVPDARAFVDDGHSGFSLRRPALDRLRDQAEAGAFDRLYVLSPDRLTRKYAYQVLLLEELQRAGVEVVFLSQPARHGPEDELVLQVQGMLAEYERARILERVRRGKVHAARQGKVEVLAHAPYGYRYVCKADGGGAARLDVLLEEARVVRQVFHWVGVERLSLSAVCRRLADGGVPTRRGGPRWHPSTVAGLLRNPAYQGQAAYGKTRRGPPRPRPALWRGRASRADQGIYACPVEEQITLAVPALVSPELFAAAAEQLEENKKQQRQRQAGRGQRHLLAGLVVCGACGYAMYGQRTFGRYSYYRCGGNSLDRSHGLRRCPVRSVRAAELEAAVWQDVAGLLREPEKLEEEYRRRQGQAAAAPGAGSEVRKEVEKAKRLIKRLIDAYAQELLKEDEFAPRLAEARARLARLEQAAAEEAAAHEQHEALRLVLGPLQEFAAQIQEGVDQADWNTRREVLKALVKRVVVDREEVRIVYRIRPPFVDRPDGGDFKGYQRRSHDQGQGGARLGRHRQADGRRHRPGEVGGVASCPPQRARPHAPRAPRAGSLGLAGLALPALCGARATVAVRGCQGQQAPTWPAVDSDVPGQRPAPAGAHSTAGQRRRRLAGCRAARASRTEGLAGHDAWLGRARQSSVPRPNPTFAPVPCISPKEAPPENG
jgi:site-specific DNA recombinase